MQSLHLLQVKAEISEYTVSKNCHQEIRDERIIITGIMIISINTSSAAMRIIFITEFFLLFSVLISLYADKIREIIDFIMITASIISISDITTEAALKTGEFKNSFTSVWISSSADII